MRGHLETDTLSSTSPLVAFKFSLCRCTAFPTNKDDFALWPPDRDTSPALLIKNLTGWVSYPSARPTRVR